MKVSALKVTSGLIKNSINKNDNFCNTLQKLRVKIH